MSGAMAGVFNETLAAEYAALKAELGQETTAQLQEKFEQVVETGNILKGGQETTMEFTGNKQVDRILYGAGFRSAQQVIDAARADPAGLMQIRDIGPKRIRFILDTLDPEPMEFGVEALVELPDGRLAAPVGFTILVERTFEDGRTLVQDFQSIQSTTYWAGWEIRVVEA